jgi:hypothetical protein
LSGAFPVGVRVHDAGARARAGTRRFIVTGHGAKSVADSYGEFPVDALFRELRKIPILKLDKV